MSSKVKLICTKTKKVLVHDLEHAQNLMNYQASKGFNDWEIADKEPWILKDGIISKRAKGKNSETSTQDGDSISD